MILKAAKNIPYGLWVVAHRTDNYYLQNFNLKILTLFNFLLTALSTFASP